MKFKITGLRTFALLAVFGAASLASCNKDVQDAVPITTPVSTASSLNDLVNADASLTIFKAAVVRASTGTASPSLATLLSDRTAQFTVFAPSDAAFQSAFALLGIPSAVGINAFRAGQLDTILRYHIVGGNFPTSLFPTAFPNAQLPSQFVLAAPVRIIASRLAHVGVCR